MRILARRVQSKYRRSWIGEHASPSRGLLLVITVAIVALTVTVPWMIDKNADAARVQVAVNALEDQRRDCVRAALSGADLKATSMAGVDHADSTAAVFGVIRNVLNQVAPNSSATQQITPAIDDYVAGVARFRRIAEQYQPRTIGECRAIGAGVLEPLPPNPIVPPTTGPGG